MNTRRTLASVFVGAVAAGSAQATLIDRGRGLIYDDVLNVTWLQDANYAKTSGYDADGRMNWVQAKNWSESLVFGGYDDWRLPTMEDTDGPDLDAFGNDGCDVAYSGTDCGWNAQTYDASSGHAYSELAYTYYVNLGLRSYYNANGLINSNWGVFGNGSTNGTDVSSHGQNDVGLINNLQSWAYWSGLKHAPVNETVSSYAWAFYPGYGEQFATNQGYEYFAWAVRDGDVAAVPEPEAYAMFLAGLGLVGVMAGRRKSS